MNNGWYTKNGWSTLLNRHRFVFKGVLFIPNSLYWPNLYGFEWDDINPTIEGML